MILFGEKEKSRSKANSNSSKLGMYSFMGISGKKK